MDPTILTILLILVFASFIALLKARKKDACLVDFDGFHVTVADKAGNLIWGRIKVYPNGYELIYNEPVETARGHYETSYIFFKEQFPAMDVIYRYPRGLTASQQEKRQKVIERTSNPGLLRRVGRRLMNWLSMVRDAIVQAVTVVIGAARARAPGSVVLGTQEQSIRALSGEIIGYAGNAYDPLLEDHLFKPIVVDVTREGKSRSFYGLLKDYTSEFLEVVDAVMNRETTDEVIHYAPGAAGPANVSITVSADRLVVKNEGREVLFVQDARTAEWERFMGVVVPPEYMARLTLPREATAETLRVGIGIAGRVDLVVPRTHAIIRHAAR